MRLLTTALASLAALGAGSGDATAVYRGEVLGRSAQGRVIFAAELGNPRSPRKVVVVGCIHGNECAGIRVARHLVRTARPRTYHLWVVRNVNPDGFVRGTRQNARGVDLNRNFPRGWTPIGRRWDATYSGPYPLSEPETRVMRRFLLRVRPDLTIWFHQPQRNVRAWSGPSLVAARRYAPLAGTVFRRLPVPPGAATRWQDWRFPGTASFVVELAPGPLTAARAARHAWAIRALASSP